MDRLYFLPPTPTDLRHIAQWAGAWFLAAAALTVFLVLLIKVLDKLEDKRQLRFFAQMNEERAAIEARFRVAQTRSELRAELRAELLRNVEPVSPATERKVLEAMARAGGAPSLRVN